LNRFLLALQLLFDGGILSDKVEHKILSFLYFLSYLCSSTPLNCCPKTVLELVFSDLTSFKRQIWKQIESGNLLVKSLITVYKTC